MDINIAKSIYETSETYRDAALILMQRAMQPRIEVNTRMKLINVVIANEAFSVEHALKCLLYLEKGHKVRGHDLELLFKKLTKNAQDKLSSYFMDLRMAKYLRLKRSGAPIPLVYLANRPTAILLEQLKQCNLAFEKFRYPYDMKPEEYNYNLGDVLETLHWLIMGLHPEWGYLSTDLTNVIYPHAEFVKRQDNPTNTGTS